MFIGRTTEIKSLSNLYQTNHFSFGVVYGRRRVGKSTLINKVVKDLGLPTINFMALEQNDTQNLAVFTKLVLEALPKLKGYISTFSTWMECFDYIVEEVGDKKLVLVIDEFPYLADANKSIFSILQKYIDYDFKKTNLTLILCGSSMSFMENQVLGSQSPLYGRRDMQLKVEPFNYLDSIKFFDHWPLEEKMIGYGVVGGIPLYLSQLSKYDNVYEAIKNVFFKVDSPMFEEPRNLLLQELRQPAIYNTIITKMADGATKVNEISSKSLEDSAKVTKYISTLNSLHITKKETSIINPKERNSIYVLADNMFRFYYRFVLPNIGNIKLGMDDYVLSLIKPLISEYMGHIFEQISKEYLMNENKNLRLEFVFNEIGRWWGNNPVKKIEEEIDIVALGNKAAIFAECKWQNDVSLTILGELVRKSALFKFDHKSLYLFIKGEITASFIKKAKTLNIKIINLEMMI